MADYYGLHTYPLANASTSETEPDYRIVEEAGGRRVLKNPVLKSAFSISPFTCGPAKSTQARKATLRLWRESERM